MNLTAQWVLCLRQESGAWQSFLEALSTRSAEAAEALALAANWEDFLRRKGRKEALDDLCIELTASDREERAQDEYRARTSGAARG